MGWTKPVKALPSKHDHVGHMLFSDTTAVCTAPGCEQAWDFDKKQGWIPIVDGNPMRKQWAKKTTQPTKKKVERLAAPEENYMNASERDIFDRINKGLKKKREVH